MDDIIMFFKGYREFVEYCERREYEIMEPELIKKHKPTRINYDEIDESWQAYFQYWRFPVTWGENGDGNRASLIKEHFDYIIYTIEKPPTNLTLVSEYSGESIDYLLNYSNKDFDELLSDLGVVETNKSKIKNELEAEKRMRSSEGTASTSSSASTDEIREQGSTQSGGWTPGFITEPYIIKNGISEHQKDWKNYLDKCRNQLNSIPKYPIRPEKLDNTIKNLNRILSEMVPNIDPKTKRPIAKPNMLYWGIILGIVPYCTDFEIKKLVHETGLKIIYWNYNERQTIGFPPPYGWEPSIDPTLEADKQENCKKCEEYKTKQNRTDTVDEHIYCSQCNTTLTPTGWYMTQPPERKISETGDLPYQFLPPEVQKSGATNVHGATSMGVHGSPQPSQGSPGENPQQFTAKGEERESSSLHLQKHGMYGSPGTNQPATRPLGVHGAVGGGDKSINTKKRKNRRKKTKRKRTKNRRKKTKRKRAKTRRKKTTRERIKNSRNKYV